MDLRRVIWLGVALALQCLAQETTAGLQGNVKDATGGSIPSAVVEVSSPALIGSRKAQTDSAGFYHVGALPPGEYTLSVNAPGFRAYRQPGIPLTVGRMPTVDVQLQLGAVA